MQEEAKGQEADANAIFTGNWPEVVYTLKAEARFAEARISICRFFDISTGVFRTNLFLRLVTSQHVISNMFGQI